MVCSQERTLHGVLVEPICDFFLFVTFLLYSLPMDYSLTGLFLSAFISSTLLPGSSEAVLLYLSSESVYSFWVLVAVASAGNTLGGMTSWGLGRLIAVKYGTDRIHKAEYQQAISRIQHYGYPVLLLSWVPVIGDPLCVAAGWLRMNVYLGLILIALGKTLRYMVILSLFV